MRNVKRNIVCELCGKTLRSLRLKEKTKRREHKDIARDAKKNSL